MFRLLVCHGFRRSNFKFGFSWVVLFCVYLYSILFILLCFLLFKNVLMVLFWSIHIVFLRWSILIFSLTNVKSENKKKKRNKDEETLHRFLSIFFLFLPTSFLLNHLLKASRSWKLQNATNKKTLTYRTHNFLSNKTCEQIHEQHLCTKTLNRLYNNLISKLKEKKGKNSYNWLFFFTYNKTSRCIFPPLPG